MSSDQLFWDHQSITAHWISVNADWWLNNRIVLPNELHNAEFQDVQVSVPGLISFWVSNNFSFTCKRPLFHQYICYVFWLVSINGSPSVGLSSCGCKRVRCVASGFSRVSEWLRPSQTEQDSAQRPRAACCQMGQTFTRWRSVIFKSYILTFLFLKLRYIYF